MKDLEDWALVEDSMLVHTRRWKGPKAGYSSWCESGSTQVSGVYETTCRRCLHALLKTSSLFGELAQTRLQDLEANEGA